MRFNYFHLMPWDSFSERVEPWPVNNAEFDPVKATELYATYIDTMAYAEECGWDGLRARPRPARPATASPNPTRRPAADRG